MGTKIEVKIQKKMNIENLEIAHLKELSPEDLEKLIPKRKKKNIAHLLGYRGKNAYSRTERPEGYDENDYCLK